MLASVGVVKELVLDNKVPPEAALYHAIADAELAVRVTVPLLHLDTSFVTGVAVTGEMIACTLVLLLRQVPPVST